MRCSKEGQEWLEWSGWASLRAWAMTATDLESREGMDSSPFFLLARTSGPVFPSIHGVRDNPAATGAAPPGTRNRSASAQMC